MDTPCIKICAIDEASGLCAGCLRSRDEIAGWIGIGHEARLRIMAELPVRRAGRPRDTALTDPGVVRR